MAQSPDPREADTDEPLLIRLLTIYDSLLARIDHRYGEGSERGRIVLVAVVAAVVLAALAFVIAVLWVVIAIGVALVGAATGAAAEGVDAATSSQFMDVITKPVHAYLTEHAAGLPITAEALWKAWAVTGVGLWLLGLFRSWGVRLAWTLYGASTVAMVYAESPAAGQALAAGVAVLAWAVVSLPVFAGIGRRSRTLINLPAPVTSGETAVALVREQVAEMRERLNRLEVASDELSARRTHEE
ncbi:hypothetical protein [Microtetraspora glauca]|uniref:Uncharacterized protein n=1 Tax=Microtetraspora glauca TaxID=1996 RepID=A0ABV3GDF3_MICGL